MDRDDRRRRMEAHLSGTVGDPDAAEDFPLKLCEPTWCKEQPWIDPELTVTTVEIVTDEPDLGARIVRDDGTEVVDSHVEDVDEQTGEVAKVMEFAQNSDNPFSRQRASPAATADSPPSSPPGPQPRHGFRARTRGPSTTAWATTCSCTISDNVHASNIDCVAWYGITKGTGPQMYSPAQTVRRDQMASCLGRILRRGAADGHVTPPTP